MVHVCNQERFSARCCQLGNSPRTHHATNALRDLVCVCVWEGGGAEGCVGLCVYVCVCVCVCQRWSQDRNSLEPDQNKIVFEIKPDQDLSRRNRIL